MALAGCGGGGGSDTPPPAPNQAPTIQARGNASVPENMTGTVFTATATDPDNDPLTYVISGGPDAALLQISAAGAMSFRSPVDFEAPADANADNIYTVEISVSDGKANARQLVDIAITDVTGGAYGVRKVAGGFDRPTNLVAIPGDTARVLVSEKTGQVHLLTTANGMTANTPFMDVSAEIAVDGDRGLIGLVPAPDFAQSGRVYVALTTPAGNLELRRYRTLAQNKDQIDPASADIILRVASPNNQLVGGSIAFGPDGFLYIGTGAGTGTGENTGDLLGKILRVDVASDAFPGDDLRDYAIPAGNPFATAGGAPEIWTLGMLHPRKLAFDLYSGHLWVNDYGEYLGIRAGYQSELNWVRPQLDVGSNYSSIRGVHSLASPPIPDPFRYPVVSGRTGLAPPDPGQAAFVGGYVYRGSVEALQGHYVTGHPLRADYGSLAIAGMIQNRANPYSPSSTPSLNPAGPTLAFGEDGARNLYILATNGDIFVVVPA
ncbi:MAG: PQQ-dependent sugar dehydrogenase [Sphingopyxis sp.]|nr:PQQ-dependent sugar dehydrogenase [Sphingopyxis sp.]